MRTGLLHLKELDARLGLENRDPILEYYLPYNMTEMNRENQKRPCLLIFPGGGYTFTSQREAEPVALHFLPEGYNVFVLWYSCSPAQFPVQLREAAAAMDCIAGHGEEWNCDTERIAVMGFSAGGHLAAHYSTRYDCEAVREWYPESRRPAASILGYPVIRGDQLTHSGSLLNLVGHFPLTKEEERFFDCAESVTPATPPAFLWHTAEDGTVPVENSLKYAAALSANKVSFEMHIFPKGFHGLSTCDEQTVEPRDVTDNLRRDAQWLMLVKQWLKKVL